MTVGSVTLAPLLQATRTIPIVFVNIADPVGAGFIESLARPAATPLGFTNFEFSMSGKWLELLKQIAPHGDSCCSAAGSYMAGIGSFGAMGARRPRWIELTRFALRLTGETDNDLAAFARSGNGGVIVVRQVLELIASQIIPMASRYELPAVPFSGVTPLMAV